VPIIFDVPREERRAVTSVKNAILARVKDLTNKKKRKKNARKTAIKNINKLKTINKKQKRSTKPQTKQKFSQEKERLYKSMQKQLNSAFNKGLFTPEQYERFSAELLKKILDNRRAGGII